MVTLNSRMSNIDSHIQIFIKMKHTSQLENEKPTICGLFNMWECHKHSHKLSSIEFGMVQETTCKVQM